MVRGEILLPNGSRVDGTKLSCNDFAGAEN
jgi:hypothetical protein